jgi:hypothetical protein
MKREEVMVIKILGEGTGREEKRREEKRREEQWS